MLRGVYFELEFSRRSITELARTCLITNYPPANPLLPPTGRVYPTSDDGTQWVSVNTAFLTEPGASFIRHGAPISWTYEWEDLYEHAENIPAADPHMPVYAEAGFLESFRRLEMSLRYSAIA